MTVLFRYLLRQYLQVFGLALGAFVVLFQVFDFVERFDFYFKENPATGDVLELIALKTLPALALMIPVATLLASVISLAVLNRNNEIVAMRSLGVGFRRLGTPLLACGLAASLAVVALNEWVLPGVNERIHYLEAVRIGKVEKLTFFKKDQVWFKDDRRVYHVDLFLPTEGVMRGVTLYELDEKGRPIRRISAAEGRLDESGQWKFTGTFTADLDDDPGLSAEPVEVPFGYGAESLAVLEKRPDEMNFAELRLFVEKIRHERLRTHAYETEMHGRLAFALVCLMLSVVGLPFSYRPARKGGATLALAAAIGLGFSYWFLFSFALKLGKGGSYPPLLAAWSPNVLFTGALIFFYRRMR